MRSNYTGMEISTRPFANGELKMACIASLVKLGAMVTKIWLDVRYLHISNTNTFTIPSVIEWETSRHLSCVISWSAVHPDNSLQITCLEFELSCICIASLLYRYCLPPIFWKSATFYQSLQKVHSKTIFWPLLFGGITMSNIIWAARTLYTRHNTPGTSLTRCELNFFIRWTWKPR